MTERTFNFKTSPPLGKREKRIRFIIPVRLHDRLVVCEATEAGLTFRARYSHNAHLVPWKSLFPLSGQNYRLPFTARIGLKIPRVSHRGKKTL